jgi:hypothetical protein
VVGLPACVWVVWVVPPPLVATRMTARTTSAPRSEAAARKPGRVHGLRRSPGSWGLRGAMRRRWPDAGLEQGAGDPGGRAGDDAAGEDPAEARGVLAASAVATRV